MYFDFKFNDNVESQIGLLAPAGGIKLLEENLDALKFDGIQTTTWYTRFFDEESFSEMASNPLVYPQNFYIETPNIPRSLLKFTKLIDLVSSYLSKTMRFVIMNSELSMPFDYYEAYNKWLANNDLKVGGFKFSGDLNWDDDEIDIINFISKFLKNSIVPLFPNSPFLKDLLNYELYFTMINAGIREEYYGKTCTSVDLEQYPSYNIIKSPEIPTEITCEHRVWQLLDQLENSNMVSEYFIEKTTYKFQKTSNTKFSVTETIQDVNHTKTFDVFRQVEF